jgi:hypothetical protein
MVEWAWDHLQLWIDVRLELRVGALFCVINGPAHGRPWSAAAARADLPRPPRSPALPTPSMVSVSASLRL